MNKKELAEQIAKAETEAENQLVENILSEFERIGIDTSEWEEKFGDGNFAHEFIAAGIQDHLEKIEAMGKPEVEADHNPNVHNLDITYTGVCRKCGGTNLMDAPSPTQVEAMGEKPEALTIDDCQYLLFYGYNKEKTIDLGTEDNGQLDYAITQMFLMLQESTRFDAKRVERVFWERIKALANRSEEAMGVQPGMSEADNISIAADAYIDKFWYEQDRKTKRLMHMAYRAGAMSMLNNEQEVKVSDTTDDAQRYVADNQEAIAKCDNPPCSNVKFNTLAGFNLCTCGWSEAIEPKGE